MNLRTTDCEADALTTTPSFVGCSISSVRSLEAVSQSSDYNAVGEFRCRDNKILLYFNKTKVVSTKTICLATAQWKDSDVVKCWAGECSKIFVLKLLIN